VDGLIQLRDALLWGESPAQSIFVLSMVAVAGLALGRIRIFGISLGIAGVLFAGLLVGHFRLSINHSVQDFAREFGLILFVYSVGIQVGPGFFASLRRHGLPLNLAALAIVLLGALITLLISVVGHIPMPVAAGLFSGATTNTPSLAAIQQTLQELPGTTADIAKQPGLGYAVAYPFGVIGIILTMLFMRFAFRIDTDRESAALARLLRRSTPSLGTVDLEVQNPNLDGVPLSRFPGLAGSNVVISRILHEGEVRVAQTDTIVSLGDVLHAVGPAEKLEQLRMVVGTISALDVTAVPGDIVARRVIVTRNEVVGKRIEELDLTDRHGVSLTRLERAGVELTVRPGLRLQFADSILAVGLEAAIGKVAAELGDSPKQLDHPQIVPMFVGIVLGIIAGSIPMHIPGVPAPVKLGLAGGPLLVAVILSRIGRIGPLIWYLPPSANLMVRELGIILFLAAVGLKAGDQFVATLVSGPGFYWMACAALITLLPLLIVAVIARMVYKVGFPTLCGLLAGSMTDPPALAFAGTMTKSDLPSISYATVYPMVMLMRVVAAQLLVLFFTR